MAVWAVMNTYRRRFRIGASVTLAISYVIIGPSFGIAVAASSGSISESYKTTDRDITQGTLVSLTASKSGVVIPATSNGTATLVGIAASNPLIELSTGEQDSVQVAVGGTVEAFVSDANGPVRIGDKITASPISGVGMKATTATEIVGTAQTDLNSISTVTKDFAATNGQKLSVKVGLLPITVNVSYYSASSSQMAIASILPPFLQSVANSITGKQVSPLRVLLGACALILGFIAITTMLYAAIRNQIISIGRNPLAQAELRKGLVDVIVAAIGVLIITVVVVYSVLFS